MPPLKRVVAVFSIVALSGTLLPVVCYAADDSTSTEMRTWTDDTGAFEVKAKLIECSDGNVTLERENGKQFTVPMTRLSRKDQTFIRAQLKKQRTAQTEPRTGAGSGRRTPKKPKVDDRGLGILPLERPAVYVHIEGMPAPKPQAAVRCRWTDPDKDPKLLVEAERQRLQTAGTRHAAWEKDLGYPLIRVETHHVVVHAQLPLPQARDIGLALEKLKNHLQQVTGNMVLTPLRPDQNELVVVFGQPSYLRLLTVLENRYQGKLGEDWALVRSTTGSSLGHLSFYYHSQQMPQSPAHMALALVGSQTIAIASGGRQPAWLLQGFSSYCEWAVMGKNVTGMMEYEDKNLKLHPNWAIASRQLVMTNMAKGWEEILNRQLRDFEPVHYVQSYSMVAFLLRSNPEKFLDFVEAVRGGKEPSEALEAAYDATVKELEEKWRRWVLQN